MPAIFDPIELTWNGKTYRIESHNILKAIARVEEHFTLVQLIEQAKTNSVSTSKLAMAYGTVLRFAGAEVTDEEVFEGVLGVGTMKAEDMATHLTTLLSMLLPRSVKALAEAEAQSRGNVQGRMKTTATSKTRTKPSSGKEPSIHRSSGA